MSVHDAMWFSGFIFMVLSAIAGGMIVGKGENMSKRKNDLPIIIGKNHHKGIMGWLDKDRRAIVNIVWLNKDIPSGQDFQFTDIDKLDATLWFCDRESIDQTIRVLEKLKKGMKGGDSDAVD